MINLSENFLGFYDRLAVLNEAKYSNDNLSAVFAELCRKLSAEASSGAIKAMFSLEGSAAADSADRASSEKAKATIHAVVNSDRKLGCSVNDVLNSLFNRGRSVVGLGFKSACEQVLNGSFAEHSVSVDGVSENGFGMTSGSDGVCDYDMLFSLTLNIIFNAFVEKDGFVCEKISPLSDFAKAGKHRLSAGQFNTLKVRLVSETRGKVNSVERVLQLLQFYVNTFISELHTKQLLQNDDFIKDVNEVLQDNNMSKRLDIACQYDFADSRANELDVNHSSGNQADIKATAASANKNAISRIEVKILDTYSLVKKEDIQNAEIVFVYRLDQNNSHALEVYDSAATYLGDMSLDSDSWPNFIRVSDVFKDVFNEQDGYIVQIDSWSRA